MTLELLNPNHERGARGYLQSSVNRYQSPYNMVEVKPLGQILLLDYTAIIVKQEAVVCIIMYFLFLFPITDAVVRMYDVYVATEEVVATSSS